MEGFLGACQPARAVAVTMHRRSLVRLAERRPSCSVLPALCMPSLAQLFFEMFHRRLGHALRPCIRLGHIISRLTCFFRRDPERFRQKKHVLCRNFNQNLPYLPVRRRIRSCLEKFFSFLTRTQAGSASELNMSAFLQRCSDRRQ